MAEAQMETQTEDQPAPPKLQTQGVLPVASGRLHAGRLSPVEHKRAELFADIPAGTAPEALLNPDYWQHLAAQLRPLDLIEAFCEDGSWEGLYRVMFVSSAEVVLSPVRITRHGQPGQIDDHETFEIKWISPSKKFGVVHRGNGSVVKDGLYPKSQAYSYLQKHLMDLNR